MDCKSGLVAAATAVLLGGVAHAATFTATWTGKVASGADDNLFGVGSASLAGADFTAVFLIDDATPGAALTQSPQHTLLKGLAAASPVAASLTIKGVTLGLGQTGGSAEAQGGSFGQLQNIDMSADRNVTISERPPGFPFSLVTYSLTSHLSLDAGSIYRDLTQGDFRAPLDFGPSYVAYPPGLPPFYLPHNFSGRFTYNEFRLSSLDTRQLDLRLSPTHLTIAANPEPSAAVPEPAAWALMILGFGAAGAMLRRRRGLTAAA